MKVLIIGTSHAGVWKNAWEKVKKENKGVELRFFITASHYSDLIFPDLNEKLITISGLQVREEDRKRLARAKKLSETFNGTSSIDISSVDVVLQVGIQNRWSEIFSILKNYDVDTLRQVGNPHKMSRVLFDSILEHCVQREISRATKFSGLCNFQYAALCPMRSETELEEWLKNNQTSVSNLKNTDGFIDAWQLFNECYQKRLKVAGIRLLQQPKETLSKLSYTKKVYSAGAKNIFHGDQKIRSIDHVHMNVDYGLISLKYFLERLQTDLHEC